ncbi:(Fe-S)-binding protein [Actinotalea ferrariae]|uniref:(Fe-S)-binding protein n=1 Tax=Actinotalea ferrariae TaxID=1386098 RepID=UPI001C8B0F8A|nr:(Fe-S)-binding protein [Actinotalea ferrariae]MBX9244771.1 (Fe-S)-binding protein [Actinotalea ferrariae]
MAALQLTALAVALVATVVGVWTFALGVRAIVRTVRRGGPAAGRTDEPWRRTWLVVKEVLGHGRFQHRPLVRVAHWVVMMSFPLLFLTLLTAYVQLLAPRFAPPAWGVLLPFEWATEAIAWSSLVGIVLLVLVRQREHPRNGRGAAGRPSAAVTPPAGDMAPPGMRASRFFGSNWGQAYVVEAIVLGVVTCVLLLRALEYRLVLDDQFWFAYTVVDGEFYLVNPHAARFPLTAWLGDLLFADWPVEQVEAWVVGVALVKILISMAWMVVVGRRPAMGVSWHRFLAVVNVWARREVDGRPALGPVPPVRIGGEAVDFDKVDELPEDARLGVGRIEDFTWKGLLDFSTCTECGRCQEQCPAWNTGKPLSPKLVVTALRDHAYATAPYLRAAANASTEPAGHTATTGHVPVPWAGLGRGAADGGAAPEDAHASLDVLTLVGDVVDPQALWDCTMCGACVQQCPVDIEHVDHVVDLRRNQVLMESAFPDELGPMFTKLERQSNPWGLPARQRLDWAKGLPFAVPVVGRDVEDASEVDYLFWVGCAGAYEDRAKKTTRAVAELLDIAGVSFAVLGDGESCSGDPARRAGNEFLFQMLAQANVEALTEARAQRIVVTCAHCFNTIAREFPQLGGRYDVVHHTELLDRLVREGRLTPVPRPADGGEGAGLAAPTAGADGAGADGAGAGASPDVVTYHDPCFLGRHNQVYTPPRDLLGALPGVRLAEMPRTKERSFCCGGGGARVWMEETTGTRISTDRAAEALGTGASAIATACPFCTIMLTDGVAAASSAAEAAGTPTAKPEVLDVARLLLDAVRPPQA